VAAINASLSFLERCGEAAGEEAAIGAVAIHAAAAATQAVLSVPRSEGSSAGTGDSGAVVAPRLGHSVVLNMQRHVGRLRVALSDTTETVLPASEALGAMMADLGHTVSSLAWLAHSAGAPEASLDVCGVASAASRRQLLEVARDGPAAAVELVELVGAEAGEAELEGLGVTLVGASVLASTCVGAMERLEAAGTAKADQAELDLLSQCEDALCAGCAKLCKVAMAACSALVEDVGADVDDSQLLSDAEAESLPMDASVGILRWSIRAMTSLVHAESVALLPAKALTRAKEAIAASGICPLARALGEAASSPMGVLLGEDQAEAVTASEEAQRLARAISSA
jgi:hypothetical protein